MGKTLQERISEHNAKLDQMMVDNGYSLKGKHFVDSKDRYVAFPVGYVCGPGFQNNGNPQPWSYSMQGENGWLQMGFPSKREADNWVAEKLDQWDAKHSVEFEPWVEPPEEHVGATSIEILIAVVILAMAILGMWLRGW